MSVTLEDVFNVALALGLVNFIMGVFSFFFIFRLSTAKENEDEEKRRKKNQEAIADLVVRKMYEEE